MGQVTHEQANLLLRLYELRREPRLREARNWFFTHFEAATPEEMMQKYPSGSELNASFLMVLTYWDMAAGFVNRGLIDDEMFFENSFEGWIAWERVRKLVPLQREKSKNPTYLAQLENFAKRFETWRDKTAPGSIDAFRQMRSTVPRVTAKSAN